MANDCLVTKLKGIVDNNTLHKLGELAIVITNNEDNFKFFNLKPKTAMELYLTGGAYFTERFGDGNLGTEKTIQPAEAAEALQFQFGVHGNGTLHIKNKYDIIDLRIGSGANHAHVAFDIDELDYCIDMTTLNIVGGWEMTGNLQGFSKLTKLSNLVVYFSQNIDAKFSDLKDCPLTVLTFEGQIFTGVPNDMVASRTTLNNLDILAMNLNVGDISQLSALRGLRCHSLYGDYALLPASLTSTQANYYAESLKTWSSRPSTSTRFAINPAGFQVNFGDSVDKVLNDLAQCQEPATAPSSKIIRIGGTRTTASDTAVSTLRNDGWTIYVNNVIV